MPEQSAQGGSVVADLVARFLRDHGVDRVFGLQGGHIQPVWDQLARLGVRIVDVRDEGSAVHMAHAHSELTGETGVALVTAGPGVTNTVTAVANASISRVPLLVFGGCPPRQQSNMGPLQDIPHTEILAPVTRLSRTLRVADQVLRELDEAWARAAGDRGEPGPVYVEIPTDVLREEVPPALVTDEHLRAKPRRRPQPHPDDVAAVAELVRHARKPAVISGRGARVTDGTDLVRFLDASGAAYLDTQESRGPRPRRPPRGRRLGALGRDARLRPADHRRPPARLPARLRLAGGLPERDGRADRRHRERAHRQPPRRGGDPRGPGRRPRRAGDVPSTATAPTRAGATSCAPSTRSAPPSTGPRWPSRPPGADGMHPNQIFAALDALDGSALDLGETVMIADGGDLLSFARLGITRCARYLDPGAFGCLGVATPFAIAASLAYPDRPVVAVTGDGAFGITATDIDTAVRHGAKIVVIVSNNRAWNIERYDQAENYGLVVGTELADSDYAALGRSLGAHGERVTDAAELPDAIRRALENAPAVVDVVTTQDAPSPDADKGLGFVPDYQALTPWNDAEIERRTS